MAGGKDYPTKGRIAAVSGIVTEGTGAVTVRADFDNPDRLLRGGGSATVSVPPQAQWLHSDSTGCNIRTSEQDLCL